MPTPTPSPGNITMSLVAHAVVIHAGNTADLQINLTPTETYSGTVNVTLYNLPQGVQQVSPVSISLNGNPVSFTVPLRAATTLKYRNTTATVVVTDGTEGGSNSALVETRPPYVKLPGNNRFWYNQYTVGIDGNVYISVPELSSLYRVSRNGTTARVADRSASCGLWTGSDGTIWDKDYEGFFLQLDPVTQKTNQLKNPLNELGCGSFIGESPTRIWKSDSGVYQVNFLEQKKSYVPELKNNGLADLQFDGNTVWGFNFDGIYAVDSTSMATTLYKPSLNGSSIRNIIAYKTNVYILCYDQTFGIYDTKTRVFTDLTRQTGKIYGLIGKDANGNIWLDTVDQRWVQYSLQTHQIRREFPEMTPGLANVTPDGGMWYSEYGSVPELIYLSPDSE